MSDAKELREAIELLSRCPVESVGLSNGFARQFRVALAAAEAHLATLPRECEVEGWTLIHDYDGTWSSCLYPTEDAARNAAGSSGDVWHPVRLTGKALLPGSKE